MIHHPELDGPFSVPSAWTSQTVDGVTSQVPTAFLDNRWNTTPGFFARNAAALAAYRVEPLAMARVWSGDDPVNPTQTVALAFPDAVTAETVLLSCGATEPTNESTK